MYNAECFLASQLQECIENHACPKTVPYKRDGTDTHLPVDQDIRQNQPGCSSTFRGIGPWVVDEVVELREPQGPSQGAKHGTSHGGRQDLLHTLHQRLVPQDRHSVTHFLHHLRLPHDTKHVAHDRVNDAVG